MARGYTVCLRVVGGKVSVKTQKGKTMQARLSRCLSSKKGPITGGKVKSCVRTVCLASAGMKKKGKRKSRRKASPSRKRRCIRRLKSGTCKKWAQPKRRKSTKGKRRTARRKASTRKRTGRRRKTPGRNAKGRFVKGRGRKRGRRTAKRVTVRGRRRKVTTRRRRTGGKRKRTTVKSRRSSKGKRKRVTVKSAGRVTKAKCLAVNKEGEGIGKKGCRVIQGRGGRFLLRKAVWTGTRCQSLIRSRRYCGVKKI